MDTIPHELNEIGPEWLTAALGSSGHADAAVVSVERSEISDIVGLMGDVCRLNVAYDGDGGLPPTFVAKCPRNDEEARLYNSVMRFYEREAGFYEHLADKVPMRVPACYFSGYDADADHHLLILEDIAPATPGDVLKGTSVDNVAVLLEKLAVLHGTFWGDDKLAARGWLWHWQREELLFGEPIVRAAWDDMEPDVAALFPDELAEAVRRRYVDDVPGVLQAWYDRPWTFIHGDYQLDNFLFQADGPAIVDWQLVMRSFPGYDVAWLLISAGTDEVVRAEDDLLDEYRVRLAAAGGPPWSRDELLDDLCWGALSHAGGQPVVAQSSHSGLGSAADRMQRRFMTLLERAVAAGMRWDLPGRLGD